MRRWHRWRRRQISRTRYLILPGPPRITAAGLRSTSRVHMVAVSDPRWF